MRGHATLFLGRKGNPLEVPSSLTMSLCLHTELNCKQNVISWQVLFMCQVMLQNIALASHLLSNNTLIALSFVSLLSLLATKNLVIGRFYLCIKVGCGISDQHLACFKPTLQQFCMLPAACFVLSINSCSNCYFQVYLHTNQRYMNQNQTLRKHLFKKQPAIQKSLMTLAQEATI